MTDERSVRLDPEWTEVAPGLWQGRGQSVGFIVREESDGFLVRLEVPIGRHSMTAIFVSWMFPSLRSAQQWCQRYFG